jgi:hypothetical protein
MSRAHWLQFPPCNTSSSTELGDRCIFHMSHFCSYVVYVDKRYGINILLLRSALQPLVGFGLLMELILPSLFLKICIKLRHSSIIIPTWRWSKKRIIVGNRLHHSFWLWNEQAVIFILKATASLKQHTTVHLKHDSESFLSKLCSLNLRKSRNLVESRYKTHSLFFHLPLWDCHLCHNCKNKGNHPQLEPTLWLNTAFNMLAKHNSGFPINKHMAETFWWE